MHTAHTQLVTSTVSDVTIYLYRNPDTCNRPSFSDILSSLSLADKQLLMINKEDPVTVLGGALETSHSLYTDLQYMYKN